MKGPGLKESGATSELIGGFHSSGAKQQTFIDRWLTEHFGVTAELGENNTLASDRHAHEVSFLRFVSEGKLSLGNGDEPVVRVGGFPQYGTAT